MNKIEKELKGLEEALKTKIYIVLHRATFKKIPNWKTPGNYGIHGYWFKKNLPSTTEWLSKWIDAYKKQTYPIG